MGKQPNTSHYKVLLNERIPSGKDSSPSHLALIHTIPPKNQQTLELDATSQFSKRLGTPI
jgi:hypothetical protein